MSCFICGRGNCTPSFHSHDEQAAFERAGEVYERFLDIREECRQEWLGRDAEDEDEGA